jgi:copper homeostasis protein
MRVLLEVCVDDAAGIDAAVSGGADRIELCSALELGGLTPSPALLRRAVQSGAAVHAMVRPRSGGFVLRAGDLALMRDEIERALAEGATGVVIGALLPDGSLDQDALAAFREAARDRMIVLHRAIDLTPDPVAAVEQACALGYDKILSSGGALTAIEGSATLSQMVLAARGRLSVMPGSGINPGNVGALVAATGAREIHASASAPDLPPEAAAVRLGFAIAPRRITDAGTVRRLRAAIDFHEAASTARETIQ